MISVLKIALSELSFNTFKIAPKIMNSVSFPFKKFGILIITYITWKILESQFFNKISKKKRKNEQKQRKTNGIKQMNSAHKP